MQNVKVSLNLYAKKGAFGCQVRKSPFYRKSAENLCLIIRKRFENIAVASCFVNYFAKGGGVIL